MVAELDVLLDDDTIPRLGTKLVASGSNVNCGVDGSSEVNWIEVRRDGSDIAGGLMGIQFIGGPPGEVPIEGACLLPLPIVKSYASRTLSMRSSLAVNVLSQASS